MREAMRHYAKGLLVAAFALVAFISVLAIHHALTPEEPIMGLPHTLGKPQTP